MDYAPRRERTYVFHTVGGARGLALHGFSEAQALAAHVAGGGGFAEIDLSGRCLRGMDLRDVDFRGARLRNADLRGCNVGYAKFGGADLSGADLAGIHGHGPSFEDCVLERHAGKPTAFDGADIPGASFARARAVGASFSKADMEKADLSDMTADGCEFRGTRLGDAEHARARYLRCDFAKADLRSLSQRNRRGVTRINRTVGTEAFRNAYDGATMDDVVPAFASDRRMSAVSKGLAFGLAGLAVAGGLAGGEHLLPHAAESLRHAAESAGLAERLEALTHYRHVADLLASTAPGAGPPTTPGRWSPSPCPARCSSRRRPATT